MKKIILTAAIALVLASPAMAQSERGNRQPRMDRTEMVKQRTKSMVERYGLDEKQAASLQELNEKMMPQMGGRPGGPRQQDGERAQRQQRDRRQDVQGNDTTARRRPMGMRGGMNMEAYTTELQKIMTPEQFKAYNEDMQKMMQRGGNRGNRGGFRGGNRDNNN